MNILYTKIIIHWWNKEDTNKLKKSLIINWNNIIKIGIWPKAIYAFSSIPIKIKTIFYSEIEKKSKISLGPENILHSHSNLEPKEQNWRYHTSPLKIYYKAIVIKQYDTSMKQIHRPME